MRHLLLFTCLLIGQQCLTAQAVPLDTVGYLADFRSKWINAAAYTIEVAEAMPGHLYDFRPTEAQMSFREQLLHIASNMHWLSTTYLDAEEHPENLKDSSLGKVDCIALLRKHFSRAAVALFEADPATLDEVVDFFAGPMHRRKVLMLMNDHVTHHRGQLIIYLRLNGIEPPSYRGW